MRRDRSIQRTAAGIVAASVLLVLALVQPADSAAGDQSRAAEGSNGQVEPTVGESSRIVIEPKAPKPAPVGEAARYEERILWLDEDHRHALFLPEVVTANETASDLPMKDYQRRILENQLEVYRMPGRGERCSPATSAAGQGARADAQTLEELVLSGEVALVGTVVRRVGGWTPWTMDVVTAVYVEVGEIIHVDKGVEAPSVGSVIAILYEGGETMIEGIRMCDDPPEEFPLPLIGDRLLLSGEPWSADSNYFYDSARFPVVDGEVRPQPRYDLKADERPRSLQEVVQKVRAEVQARGRQ